MQDVQTRIRRPAPLIKARTDCKFTFQRRFVTLWAWLIRLPNCGPFPQTSQTCAIRKSPHRSKQRLYQPQPIHGNRVLNLASGLHMYFSGGLPEVLGKETILVVEDAEAIRRLVCSMLGQQGYQCLEAVDGV